MNIFDDVNSLPEAVIARRLGLSSARDGKSFVCPECGNGSGKTGDGIKQTKFKGKLVWHCYRCGGHWSNVDLVAQVEGISISDTAELAKKLEEVFPEYRNETFLFSKGKLATKSLKSTKPFLFSRDDSHFSAAERQASKSASRAFSYRSEGDSREASDSLLAERASEIVPPPFGEQKKLASEQEPKNYAKLYEYCQRNVSKFLVERGGSYSG